MRALWRKAMPENRSIWRTWVGFFIPIFRYYSHPHLTGNRQWIISRSDNWNFLNRNRIVPDDETFAVETERSRECFSRRSRFPPWDDFCEFFHRVEAYILCIWNSAIYFFVWINRFIANYTNACTFTALCLLCMLWFLAGIDPKNNSWRFWRSDSR